MLILRGPGITIQLSIASCWLRWTPLHLSRLLMCFDSTTSLLWRVPSPDVALVPLAVTTAHFWISNGSLLGYEPRQLTSSLGGESIRLWYILLFRKHRNRGRIDRRARERRLPKNSTTYERFYSMCETEVATERSVEDGQRAKLFPTTFNGIGSTPIGTLP